MRGSEDLSMPVMQSAYDTERRQTGTFFCVNLLYNETIEQYILDSYYIYLPKYQNSVIYSPNMEQQKMYVCLY